MRDCRAEGAGSCALGIDVDPLVVVGGVGEQVDPPLVDEQPSAVAQVLTDGSYSLQVKVPGGGSVDPGGYRYLDVADPAAMKGGLDRVSLPNFVAAARGAVERSGLELGDIALVCPLHTKRSMFLELLSGLEMREDQAVYLDDTGHMSGVDPLLGLDRAVRDGRVRDGDAVLLLSAGTGYTWAASVVRWGPLA